ncbi:exonuclease [Bacillus phage Eldridge]|uniref:Metallophosphatase n=1 Tax=Bacillus phage Eldridge TaxID=1776293 RepID=A0A109ZVS1_9CAUD|nr:exonuclease [Bacillus phage Eldridge]AMB18716.1 metallophosphatase [Bacillus phage Eldridge]
MSIEKLTEQEIEALSSQEGAYAVIMGYLKITEGKIAPSRFNKLIHELGYARVKPKEVSAFARRMQEENGVLYSLYKKAYYREVRLEDIPDIVGEPKGLEEKNIFDILSTQVLMKEKANIDMREFRKLQKEGALMKIFLDELTEKMLEEMKGYPVPKYLKTPIEPPKKGDRSLILCLADLHIGFVSFDMHTGSYSFQRLTTSVNDIVDYVLNMIEERDIKHVYVLMLGDLVENNIMRKDQSWDIEFHLAEQVAKGFRLTLDILSKLSKFIHVNFAIIAGNHDRFDQDKKQAIFNNNVAYTILDQLFAIQEKVQGLPNVTLHDNRADVYKMDLTIAGKRVVGVHGDHMPKGNEKIPAFMRDGIEVFLLLSGHLHTTGINQESFSRLRAQVGSTIGENPYSRLNQFPTTGASQMVIILKEGSNTPELIPLMLDKEGRLEA